MRAWLIFAALTALVCVDASGQSFIFGAKGGVTMGLQQWNGFSRDPLWRYHFDGYLESFSEENKYAVFGSLGYHVRGGSIRTRRWFDPETMREFPGGRTDIAFNNIVLTVGGKQKFPVGLDSRLYYSIMLRGEYTVGTDFEGYLSSYEGAENKFVFGVGLGAGFEVPFSRFVGATFELSVHPDFSRQLFLPPQDTGFTDPITGERIILREQDVTNLSIEFTIGLRFLREVVYID